jgi:hypothetical protein
VLRACVIMTSSSDFYSQEVFTKPTTFWEPKKRHSLLLNVSNNGNEVNMVDIIRND